MPGSDARCPLCGARLTPAQVLDACEAIIDASLGVVSARCPHCQGYFEVRPRAESVGIGYVQNGRFEEAMTLPAAGMAVLRDTASGTLRVRLASRDWKFKA